MNLEMIFVVASLILAIASIVGANIWALRDPPETELQRSLSKAIDDWLEAEEGTPEIGRDSLHDSDHPS
jgi:hypothetical protein